MPIEFQREAARPNNRRQPRMAVSLETTVRERGRSAVSARIVDFTVDGCRIESGGIPMAGNHVWVRLPGLESKGAWIAWSDGNLAGISFEQPLHPAVAARFLPAAANDCAGQADVAHPAQLEPLLSRREQIMQGVSGDERSPLIRRKQPTGRGLRDVVTRHVRRVSEDRHEPRYRDELTTGPMELEVHGEQATLVDLSRSGLGVQTALDADIGTKVSVEFAGTEAIEGRIVWRSPGRAGLSLPPKSIDLSEG